MLLISSFLYGQIGIGTTTPDSSSNLTIAPDNNGDGIYKGTLLGKMTTANRNSIASPATGLMIYNVDLNCLQVNNGTPSSPVWECLQEKQDGPFSNINTAYFKPMYPTLPTRTSHSGTTPPTYSTTSTQLYGNVTANGSFVENDLFKLDFVYRTGDTYSSIIYNKTTENLTFKLNTNAYNNPQYEASITIAPGQGYFLDDDRITYYREAQNSYLEILSGTHVGRKFILSISVISDGTVIIPMGGNGAQKTTQALLSTLFEF